MDFYSRGSSLADADVRMIVATAIGSGKLGAADPNGVYFVLSSADVIETSGFCSQYCGWHTFATMNGVAVKYAFIGNGDQCPSACQAQTVSPNGNAAADGMSSVIAHELSEAATDPQLDAWYDSVGDENADKCAWSFGTTSLAPNGSKYNVTLGARQFLLQRNWVNDGAGYCAIAWARPAPVAPTADSAAPNAGSGTSQVFAFNYSSAGGFANLNDVYALFSGALNGTGACWAFYDKNAKGFYLVADSGYSVLGPLAPGAQGSLQNSQCALNGPTSSIGGAGNTLTMKLDLAFNGSFAATQNIYMYAADANGLNSGWQTRGSWTVPGSTSPVAGPVSPSSGSGLAQVFTFKYSSANGAGYLKDLYALFNSRLSGVGACWVLYDKLANAFFMANDPGYGTVGPLAPGSGSTLQNSQCSLSGAGSSVNASGNTLTVTLNLTFNKSFAGTQTIFTDAAGANSGWQKGGIWTVPLGNPAPTADSVTPNSGGAANASFTFKYSSPNGSGSLIDVYLLFNGALNGSGACWILYDKAANGIFLANDSASGTVGPLPLGTNATLQNSQCTVNLAGSYITGSGNTLALILNLSFNHSFAGTQNIFMYAADSGGLNSGWQNRGAWTVP